MKTGKNLRGVRMLPLLALCAVVLSGFLNQMPGIELLKVSILTLILTTTSVFFIHLQEGDIYHQKFSTILLMVGYLVPIFLILFSSQSHIYSFWMLGGLTVAMLVDAKLGLLYIFNHTFLLGFILSLPPDTIIYYLIMGVLICLLSGALKNKETIIYATIIILSTNITLAFVLNNFLFEFNSDFNYISSIISIFLVLLTAFFIYLIYNRFMGGHGFIEQAAVTDEKGVINEDKKELKPDYDRNLQASLAPEPLDRMKLEETPILSTMELSEESETCPETVPENVYKDRGARTSYELLIADSNGLLNQMKDFSEVLYQHSLNIADLSTRAAETIKADPIIAKAGGLYHEVGKIHGKDYILEGQKIAEDYGFPKTLKAILRQHNIKYDKPASVEAAIVMLSDNVLSTIEYINKSEDKRFTTDKIIDNLFQLRMEKGTFDESGLSLKDFKTLKDFYQNEFRKQQK